MSRELRRDRSGCRLNTTWTGVLLVAGVLVCLDCNIDRRGRHAMIGKDCLLIVIVLSGLGKIMKIGESSNWLVHIVSVRYLCVLDRPRDALLAAKVRVGQIKGICVDSSRDVSRIVDGRGCVMIDESVVEHSHGGCVKVGQ